MTQYIFSPPATPTVAVAGTDQRFPVRRIFCVGRNYAAHAREMGKDPDREPPFFFMKPADTVVDSGATIPYPPETKNLHFEMELVVAIGAGGENIEPADALSCVFGYAAGIDLTRRDLQNTAKDLARPWDWSKGFDNSAPCGPIQPAAAIGYPASGRIWLAVNGATKQDADIAELIWPVPDIVSFISASMALAPGDLIFTGTPAGVGPVKPGETLTGGIDGVGEITIHIAP
jgi:fumarylpyruvate hydrolase